MGTLYLAHHGIKGQKWGVRRFQNPDGTLTALGKERYYTDKDIWSDATPELKQKMKTDVKALMDTMG